LYFHPFPAPLLTFIPEAIFLFFPPPPPFLLFPAPYPPRPPFFSSIFENTFTLLTCPFIVRPPKTIALLSHFPRPPSYDCSFFFLLSPHLKFSPLSSASFFIVFVHVAPPLLPPCLCLSTLSPAPLADPPFFTPPRFLDTPRLPSSPSRSPRPCTP